jgi:glyoxylase-like metal-dependent hydrolase (beta-lactamase superfamily II)
VILTPVHTPGSAVLHFASLDALLVGDAFATYAVTTGQRGPRVAPFTADAAQAVSSLARIEGLERRSCSRTRRPVHGFPAEAAKLVRERA